MNPSFKKDEHVLTLDLYNRQPDMEIVLSTAEYYRLRLDRAQEIVRNVGNVVGRWKSFAKRVGLSPREIYEAEDLFK